MGTKYDLYLKSNHWLKTREAALVRAGRKCQRKGCRRKYGLQVHHLTYIRLGRELPDDLLVLCEEHHEEAHGIAYTKFSSSVRGTITVVAEELVEKHWRTVLTLRHKLTAAEAEIKELKRQLRKYEK